MSLVDYASSSDDDVPEDGKRKQSQGKPEVPIEDRRPPAPPPNRIKSESSASQKPEPKPLTSVPCTEKLPDASLLLSSPMVSSNLVNSNDHSSRVAAAMAANASRKRDSNGLASSTLRSKIPKVKLTPSRTISDTVGGMLVPPQLSGRKNIVTEDIRKLFVKKHAEPSS